MAVRRVVTGQDADGNSVVVVDALVDAAVVEEFPGFEPHEIWAVDDTATVPAAELPAPTTAYFPPVNGVRFQVITFPPGAFARGEGADDPAMHVTDTVDYIYIAAGTVTLELADGPEIDLNAGDTVVQLGVRHAWRNRSDAPCVVVGTLVGAHRIAAGDLLTDEMKR